MKRLLLATALLCTASAAQAGQLSYTRLPPHWLLDRGPRVVQVPPYVSDGQPLTTRSAVNGGWNEEPGRVAKALEGQRRCAPVRVSGDTVAVHPASGCR